MGKKRKPRPDDRARVVDAGDSGGKVKKKKANGATTKASRRKGGGASANGDGRPYDPSRTLSKPAPPPPAYTPSVPAGAYITPEHDEYDACVARSYVGFVVDPPRVLPDELHADVAAAFKTMAKRGLFTRDVLAAGKTVSPTFVSRTLVGERGMTYHYQKLRIFALPWSDEDAPEGSPLRVVRRLNDAMKRRSRALLMRHGDARVGDVTGSCEFNVTLINLMEPERKESVALKDEGQFGMGKASVSWHSDSSLQDTSTVAVYHQTSGGIDGDDTSWHIALKCLDGVTPALRVPLRSHSTYYMMRDFNLHHHHAVLNGDTRRFSSTHRVAVTAKDTFDYIKGRCERALAVLPSLKWRAGRWPRGTKPPRDAATPLSNAVRVLGETHREVEFQWIRMFWLQGARHAAQHDGYWTRRIEELTQAWDVMELGLRFVSLFFYLRIFRASTGDLTDVVFCSFTGDGRVRASRGWKGEGGAQSFRDASVPSGDDRGAQGGARRASAVRGVRAGARGLQAGGPARVRRRVAAAAGPEAGAQHPRITSTEGARPIDDAQTPARIVTVLNESLVAAYNMCARGVPIPPEPRRPGVRVKSKQCVLDRSSSPRGGTM